MPVDQGLTWWMYRTIAMLLAAVVVAALVFAISDRLPASYQSSAVVRVSVQATDGISDPSVTAANDLASQFAQLASTAPVVEAAEAHLGSQAGNIGGQVTAGTIAAQNLIRISVKGSNPTQAQERTTAVANAFVAYIEHIDAAQANAYAHAVTSKLGPLDREIAAVRKTLASGNPEVQRNAAALLSSLVGEQQTVFSSVAQGAAAAKPNVQLVAPGGTGTKTSPRPLLYAAVGFLVTILLLGRLLYVLGSRRVESRGAPT